ncbi:MAG: methionyl-tRNA formyltransferase [Arcobacter sp.]|uniref:methionyl-tRNA formyltransferase n=1 Tax=Arcobacter sp. TaxID=1872629 RepID=UPI003AFF76C6
MSDVSFAFLGATKYSKKLLLNLIKNNFIPKVIFAIPEEFTISYSTEKVKNVNFSNLKKIAQRHNIRYYEIDSVEGERLNDYNALVKDLNLDLILVLGWYYMIPRSTRMLTKYGAWGIHASLLPKYAGGAPLNWAIINGEEKTGVTLFRMEDGVDDGDIIAQESFPIRYTDNIGDVYKRATKVSKKLLVDVLKNIENINFIPQDKSKIEVYPQRKKEDGEIDLKKNSNDLYNFIRAQSSPYPGAYLKTIDGKKLIIEKVRLEN